MADATYDVNKFTRLKHLKQLLVLVQGLIDDVSDEAAAAIKSGKVDGTTVNFYATADKTGTPVFSFDFPEELVLDQIKTKFEPKFKFADGSYTGATDPELDGMPVLVIAVKGDKNTLTYSFVNLEKLIDVYTAAEGDRVKLLTIGDDYTITFNISQAEGNALEVKNDGLYMSHQDVSNKADKVENATANNLAILNANGNAGDSGVPVSTILKTSDVATDDEVTAMFNEVLGTSESDGE